MYRFNRGQAEKAFKSNLYSTMVQLSGFVNYVQYLYEFHSALTDAHVHGIAQQIMHVNKDIIDTTQSFYFNDMFSLAVKCKVNGFLECYMGWKAFKPVEYGEIFLETKNIYVLQQEALETLKCIKEEYKNNSKITDIMNEMMVNYDGLVTHCEKSNHRIKYIGENLNFIFHATPLLDSLAQSVNTEILNRQEIYSLVIEKCFRIFLTDDIDNERYHGVTEFLFYSEIIEFSIKTGQGIKLVNAAGEDMSYRKVYDFFHTFIFKEYERRMDEKNGKHGNQ